jgi:peptidoglycan hydrolase-like protein with peptidoglycan-binding domain
MNKIDTDVRNDEIIGDTDGNKGECVGLVQVWLNYLGFSEEGRGPESQHVWGNAEALLREADSDKKYEPYYDVIYKKSTTDLPVPGDVIVWDASRPNTGGAGHTAVVISADHLTGTFVVFEQNAPNKGALPRIWTYDNYDHVSGWLHPKV